MLKKILGLLAALVLLAYLVFAVVRFSGVPGEQRCKGVQIQVMDSAVFSYVTKEEVRQRMLLNDLKMTGEKIDTVRLRRAEFVVSTMPMVKRAECYTSNSGTVVVRVWQFSPVLRVVQDSCGFYLNIDGQKLKPSLNSAADVPVASGSIRDTLTIGRLYRMALLLKNDSFWNAQIEQIYVKPNGEWVLIPRIGDFVIEFGLPNLPEDKMERLKEFMLKALPKAGWNTYSVINVKYRNQIVCTKKEV